MEILTQMDVLEDYYRTLQTNIRFELVFYENIFTKNIVAAICGSFRIC